MKLFVGAKGMIRNTEGKFLIVRESSDYDDGTELGKWDVVGGRIESDEPLLEGLKREVKEESGLTIMVGEMIEVTENFPIIKGEKVHVIRIYYVCSTENVEVRLSSDHDRYEWIEPAEYGKYELMDDVAELFKKYIATT